MVGLEVLTGVESDDIEQWHMVVRLLRLDTSLHGVRLRREPCLQSVISHVLYSAHQCMWSARLESEEPIRIKSMSSPALLSLLGHSTVCYNYAILRG